MLRLWVLAEAVAGRTGGCSVRRSCERTGGGKESRAGAVAPRLRGRRSPSGQSVRGQERLSANLECIAAADAAAVSHCSRVRQHPMSILLVDALVSPYEAAGGVTCRAVAVAVATANSPPHNPEPAQPSRLASASPSDLLRHGRHAMTREKTAAKFESGIQASGMASHPGRQFPGSSAGAPVKPRGQKADVSGRPVPDSPDRPKAGPPPAVAPSIAPFVASRGRARA